MPTRRLRLLAATLASVALVVGAAACGGSGEGAGDADDSGVVITPIVAFSTPTPAEPTPAPVDSFLHGFIYPIKDACLPQGDQLMPNASRGYRQGTHEGVDLYGVDNCTQITGGTPVMAARAGTVIRADHDYVSPTLEEMNALLANPNADDALDSFRGRQVWIQHGISDEGPIVSRYAHLQGIVTGLKVGQKVEAGELIAYVGESGTPESITNPGTEYHLHFELRIGDTYLGAGKPPSEVRSLYQRLFSP